jgi:hypothetical protein
VLYIVFVACVCCAVCVVGHLAVDVNKQELNYYYYYYYYYYLFTPWSTALLEKLTGLQLVKEFPVFYGTRRSVTTFTNARHLPLS